MSEQSSAAPPSNSNTFGLPEELLEVLPADPFEQLDLARKITSIALASRVSKLEDENSELQSQLAEQDELVAELRAKLETLDASLAEASQKLERALEEKEALANENTSLSNTIKKLNRDISKLEIFKKTLMQSLQEEDESPNAAARVAPKAKLSAEFSTGSLAEDEEPPEKSSSQSQSSESGNKLSDGSRSIETNSYLQDRPLAFLGSLSSTPKFTPPDSPTKRAARAESPNKLSKPSSPPRRHSIAFSTTRNMFQEKSSAFSSLPSGHRSSISSPFDAAAQTGRTRVDGKEFFRQVRSRLSMEQFTAFLSNVKELNAHKQTKEETLQKADEIFGPENKDLYTIFDGLVKRNLQ